MTLGFSWQWPRRAVQLYCFKVALATLLGYLLALGGAESAVYSAMSAALIVGASRGEDVMTSTNRVRGTLVGMLVGIALTLVALPAALAVALGVGATAYVCLAFGWGVAAARVGAALCAVMILVHVQDAVEYSLVRVGNTIIGIIAGLAVSYFVLPVRGREAVAQAADASLIAAGEMLAQLASNASPLPMAMHVAMLDRVLDLEKAVRDGRREFGKTNDTLIQTARHVGIICAGTLTAAIAHADLCDNPAAIDAAAPLLTNAARLALRAKMAAIDPGRDAQVSPVTRGENGAITPEDEISLQGLALGLRKIEFGLVSMGR
ncbi:MAG: FUSC family protein [Bosea sp. (in: a-proteobacteria)]